MGDTTKTTKTPQVLRIVYRNPKAVVMIPFTTDVIIAD